MFTISVLLLLRLLVTLSNLNPEISPMRYPKEFSYLPPDEVKPPDTSIKEFSIPWIDHLMRDQATSKDSDTSFLSWAYFFAVVKV